MAWKGTRMPLLLLFIMLLPSIGWTQEKPQVVLKLSAHKEVVVKDDQGKVRSEWQEVDSYVPGDVLRYTISYRNEGKAEARDFSIVDPIPPGTVYLANGAEGANAEITFSLDGKNFQSQPVIRYKIKGQRELEQEYFASPDMYTHIRWVLTTAVPPGGTGAVSFKVKVK